MVNGRYYDWEHITTKLKGGTLVDIESIEYSDEQKLNRKYGKGRKTRGYTLGNKQGQGKLTLMREEYDRLLQDGDVKAKGLYGIDPVNITVSFDKGEGVVHTDVLEAVKFTKRNFSGMEQDTEGPTVELEFEILGDIVSDGVPA